MTASQRHAVWALGGAQCVLWGLLYYGFAALLPVWQRELGLDRVTLAGAFSLGLLLTALLAPAVGRRLDRGQGAHVMRAGVFAAALGCVLLAASQGPAWLYLGWSVIGASMAAVLYEPAFGLVIRSIDDAGDRLRALSAVTVLGGLASTVWLPLYALAIERSGWRTATLLAAALVLLTAILLERRVLPVLVARSTVPASAAASQAPLPAGSAFPRLRLLAVAGTLAGVGLGVLLIPLLLERGASPVAAAAVLGMFGLSQLPGRIWLMRAQRLPSLRSLAALPLLLQALGLGLVAMSLPLPAALAGVALFGLGAGLQTLARPWLTQQLFGIARAGALNGRLARSQGFARAAAPLAAALLASRMPIALALGVMAGLLLLSLPLAWGLVAPDAPAPAAAEPVAP